jgi:hypothetical protein
MKPLQGDKPRGPDGPDTFTKGDSGDYFVASTLSRPLNRLQCGCCSLTLRL